MSELTIKELRAKTGMSQSQFAKRFSLNIRTLQAWESESRKDKAPQGIINMLSEIINNSANEFSTTAKAVTASELAAECGRTRSTIYLHIKNHKAELSDHIYKDGRYWLLDEYAQNYIKQLLVSHQGQKTDRE